MEALSTKRVRLRELVGSDADNLMRIFSDEAAMTFAPMAVTRERSVAVSAIEWHQENYRRLGYSAWAMVGCEGEFLGLAGLLPHEIGTELFYSLVRAHWGLGYATEVAAACRDFAFQKLGISRLISIIHPDHSKANAVARKVGMSEVGMITYWDRPNRLFEVQRRPNQSPEPTVMSVTPRADARVAPATTVAHL
jgi:RimJ/RimL family protein N-acetyltransferase